MSKFFTPAEFPELEEPVKVEALPPTPIDTEKLKEAIKLIREEINLLQLGKSKYLNVAMYFPKGLAPFMAVLQRVEQNPTNRSLIVDFIQISKQDVGARLAFRFAEILEVAAPGIKETF